MFMGLSCSCLVILLAIAVSFIQGGCEFKKSWTGLWFQSGMPNLLHINASHIETRGECYEEDHDKYLLFDRNDNCYRCMVIHEKHQSVLQYKETYCEPKASLREICYAITGDAALFSLFRKYPEAKSVACPFKSAPFTFSYNKGNGECTNPPSKAESCTDDSRLVLKYQACPDVASTESNVEELVCLATWKEGSTRYLIGRISQINRRNVVSSDEDQYRCFIYQRNSINGKTVYNIAQSGDASCNGLLNAFEGSRSMTLTTVDNHHNRCKFPTWITDHHTWLSLDHHKTYKFSQRNATLKILDDDPSSLKPPISWSQPQHNTFQHKFFGFQQFGFESQDQKRQNNNEMRVVCHSSLESPDEKNKRVRIVAHVTAGCDSGYVCMVFYKRDTNVIELQQSENYVENPDDACANFNSNSLPFTTLITTTLHPKKCPHLGRYTISSGHSDEKRKKRQQPGNLNLANQPPSPDCLSHDYEALSVGCSGTHEMEFRSTCAQQSISAYSCHGSWEENNIYYVITSPLARKSTDALRYCFIYTITNSNEIQTDSVVNFPGKNRQSAILRLSGVSESCHRHILPGITGNWALNFTSNGTCAENGGDSNGRTLMASFFIVWSLFLAGIVLR